MMGITAIGWPIARAIARKMDREPLAAAALLRASRGASSASSTVESMALEVERISEGQRFTTKLKCPCARSREAAGFRPAA